MHTKESVTKEFTEAVSSSVKGLHDAMWEFDKGIDIPPVYSDEDLKHATKIFMHVASKKLWDLQEQGGFDMELREKMAEDFGVQFRGMIKVFTGMDPHDFYK